MPQLNIYKASAGSGKTFKLTGEYLKLLFKYRENYRKILAVTFTNKATAEMKNRILSELNKLAKGNTSAYSEILKKELNISDILLQQKAKESLSLLLHDFSKFSVSTIDKFFQKIIRSFTREIGIQPGYSVELNQDDILNMVVDEVLQDMDENTALREWLINFASGKIEEGKKWEFKDDILKLSREIFKEEYKAFNIQLMQKMSNKDFLKEYISELQKIKSQFENTLTGIAGKALALIKSNGLSTGDFKWGKSGVPNYFNKIIQNKDFEPTSRTLKGIVGYDEWLSAKSEKKDIIENTLNAGLFDLLVDAVNYYSQKHVDYYTCTEILKFIHTLGILTDISIKLRDYCNEQNIFMISDAAHLLQIIIDSNDSPFIYEKTGSIYRFFMIDEFQDTSKTQWHNFKPLITNSLAQGNINLLVGDIKQSIYRWRNSDWKILSEQVQEDFSHFGVDSQSLDINWRSKKNIIQYNNSVFKVASQILQNDFNGQLEEENISLESYIDKITNAYHDVSQKIPATGNKEGGFVHHCFLNENEYDAWKDEVKTRLPEIIKDLQNKGYKPKDIAILVRSGYEGQEIANTLIEYKNKNNSPHSFDFISNDSLFLSSSSLVNFIMAILHYINNPEDEINLSYIIFEYHTYLNGSSNADYHKLLKKHMGDDSKEELKRMLPGEFLESLVEIKQLPLFELADRIVKIFRLNEIRPELPYLQAFMDIILEFGKNKAADIHTFTNWWNEQGQKQTLNVSENQDAIRIITIHQSKGLQFKCVLIPFCNWEIDHKPNQTNIIWCKTNTEPFNKLDLIPVDYSKKLAKTIFKQDYFKEKLHAFVDNLNLMYVAFTRAEEVLYSFSPVKDKIKSLRHVGDLLYFVYSNQLKTPLQNTKEGINLTEYWDNENNCFKLGELKSTVSEENKSEREITLEKYKSYDIKNKLRIKLHDNSFFSGKESTTYEKVNYGKIMHEVFENIRNENDIHKAIEKLIFEGKISQDTRKGIEEKIQAIMESKQIKEWFNPKWDVRTEPEIILKNGKTVRPDRVISNNEKTIVIDYKFGEREEEKHHKQVKAYMDIINKMENKPVEGYIWYVDLNIIKPVQSFEFKNAINLKFETYLRIKLR